MNEQSLYAPEGGLPRRKTDARGTRATPADAALRSAPPAPDRPLGLLGGLTPQQFMQRHWQKKPLLIRQALPGIAPPLRRDALFELAGRDDVESRLIAQRRGKWSLCHGPQQTLPGPRAHRWTLLVQGLNLHVAEADALLQQFRFVPDARLDDLMISYATDGGGVGPHFDSYDVFLLQVHGKRRWKISAQKNLELVEGLPLKILRDFDIEQEWVLEPGDMLYLPPHYAHDGIAVGECMTCSVGFRAHPWNELLANFLQYIAEDVAGRETFADRYTDPSQPATATPARLPEALVEAMQARLAKLRFDADDLRGFLGAYLSEPKPSVFFDAPDPVLKEAPFARAVCAHGLALDARTRMLIDTRDMHINGESFGMPRAHRKLLTRLANQRWLDAADCAPLLADTDVRESLHDWYLAGWLAPLS